MATIVKSELEGIKTKIKYYVQLNSDNSTNINKATTRLLSLYKTDNTKDLMNLTDEIMMQNKVIINNNDKYINILNRTISNYEDDTQKSERKFEKIGE